jgi:dTDP-4-amino-4,6-dideoxygalactose transaminase
MLRFNKPSIDRKDLESVLYCMISDRLTPGVQLKEFSSLLKKTLGVGHAAVFSSYVFAYEKLFSMLKAEPGDEVIIPSLARTRILNAVKRAGLVPVLVDCAEDSLLPDPAVVSAAVNEKTRCLILAQLFGIPHDLNPFRDTGTVLIEDLDGELAASIGGKKIGSFGHFAVTSFNDESFITTGNGGMLASSDRRLKEMMSAGTAGTDWLDYMMSDLNASLGVSQIKKMGGVLERRRAIGTFYDNAVLGSSCSLVGREEQQELSYTQYVVRTRTPVQEVQKFFSKNKIPVQPALGQPLHLLLDLASGEFGNTENMSASLVSIPIYPSLKKEQVERIARGMKAVL